MSQSEFHSINPATGEVLQSWPAATNAEIEQRLTAAERAWAGWKRQPFSHRRQLIEKLATQLRRTQEESARLITREMGKPVAQARAEVEKCASLCDFYAAQGESFLQPRTVTGNKAAKSYVRFEPLGIVPAVMPWNFPFWQVMRFAVPALLAGNVGLLKHATNVLGCAAALEGAFREAGFPEGVFAAPALNHASLEQIISDSRVRAITLTGSDRAGRAVAKLAGSHLKPCVLELGGSDPMIICADANLDLAADLATQSRTINNGQSCIASKRFLVQREVLRGFLERFIARMSGLKIGDPQEESTQLGPLAREDLRETLAEQVQQTVDAGAALATGGRVVDRAGWFYEPTVLTGVRPDMTAFREETFGPAAAVIEFGQLEEAIELANRSQFGLGASIVSTNLETAELMAAQLEAGCVFINDFVKSDPTLPFGGVKDSGYGRELGEFGIQEFVNVKTVWIGA